MKARENHVLQNGKTIFTMGSKLPRRRKRAIRKVRDHTDVLVPKEHPVVVLVPKEHPVVVINPSLEVY